MARSLTYADAGVDIKKAGRLVDKIKDIASQTSRSGVLGDIGGFGALYSLNMANVKNPVLVSATDGVGTKLKIAFMMDKHDTIGIDLVAMSINDIAVQGARPLFFLDYLAISELDDSRVTQIVAGIAEGCNQARCSLIGGETAEMPGIYQPGEYDLAGFAVGIADNNKIIDGSGVHVGDKIIGIASNGLHSNGYSLVRKICFDMLKLNCASYVDELGGPLGEELIKPTKIYSESIRHLIRDLPIQGLAHITGGGIEENILRITPRACQVVLQRRSWEIPPIFDFLQKAGNISDDEMMRTFNNGIGLAAIVPEKSTIEVLSRLSALNENAFVIGEVAECRSTDNRCQWI
jgi:phosphoribosylformylglycinamidine cyclo-ligase